jgi:hypothetical protein
LLLLLLLLLLSLLFLFMLLLLSLLPSYVSMRWCPLFSCCGESDPKANSSRRASPVRAFASGGAGAYVHDGVHERRQAEGARQVEVRPRLLLFPQELEVVAPDGVHVPTCDDTNQSTNQPNSRAALLRC